jgi:hypothetical protein
MKRHSCRGAGAEALAVAAGFALRTVRLCAMGRGSRLAILAVLAVCAAVPASALARVSGADQAATHAYLEAVLAERRAADATGTAQLQAIESLATLVRTECPGVLAGAPPHSKEEHLSPPTFEINQEVISATFGAAEEVMHPILVGFARQVAPLRWSNPRLTRLLRSLAREAAVQSGIPAPALCSDLRYWVASGYTKLSAGTLTYRKERSAASSIALIEPEPHEPVEHIFNLSALIRHRLEPYENRRDRQLARKAFPAVHVKQIEPALKPLLDALGSVELALGRNST